MLKKTAKNDYFPENSHFSWFFAVFEHKNMLKPHLSYIAAISVHRRTSGYPWRGGSVRSDFQCRLLYLKTYGGSREVAEDDRSLLNSWRWSLGRSKWGVKCSDPNSRISVFWTTLAAHYIKLVCSHLSFGTPKKVKMGLKMSKKSKDSKY